MARRIIGLDVGTNAVTVAVIEATDTPTLRTFGQVALPPDAMHEGEVQDPAAVTDAIQRLWRELGLKRGEVRIGAANPRMIVRQVDLPSMNEADMAGALRFQAQELIPMPIEEAIYDFQILETLTGPEGESINHVLLAAAQRDSIQRLVGSVEAAGLKVGVVDVIPLALIRVLGVESLQDIENAEAIVSLGAGTTIVVVHVAGIPRFVRIIAAGSRQLTEAIAQNVSLEPEQSAETLKRRLGDGGLNGLAEQAHAAIEQPLAHIIEEVRSSLDFYRTQPGSLPIKRVVATGGGALLPDVLTRLSSAANLPVSMGNPRAGLIVSDVGFAPDQLAGIDPYLAVPVGIAIGGMATDRRINLLPGGAHGAPTSRKGPLLAAAAAGAVVLVVAGGLTATRMNQLSSAKHSVATQKQTNSELQSEVDGLKSVQDTQGQIDNVKTQLTGILQTDVAWPRMLNSIAQTIPTDVWLTSFQGSSTPTATATTVPPTAPTTSGSTTKTTASPTTTVAPPPAGPSGTVTFQANGINFTSVAAWLERISLLSSFNGLWVQSADRSDASAVVGFNSSANITAASKSSRLESVNKIGVGG